MGVQNDKFYAEKNGIKLHAVQRQQRLQEMLGIGGRLWMYGGKMQ